MVKKFYTAIVLPPNLKLSQKIIYTVNFLYEKLIHRNLYNQKINQDQFLRNGPLIIDFLYILFKLFFNLP